MVLGPLGMAPAGTAVEATLEVITCHGVQGMGAYYQMMRESRQKTHELDRRMIPE